MSETGIIQEVQPLIQPRIMYDEALNTAPYMVAVNEEFLGQLLLDQGWGNEDVTNLKVLVKRGGDHAVKVGQYDSKKHRVRFNTEWLWNQYNSATELAKKVSNGEVRPNTKQFKDLLTTKRLSGYLASTPEDRGLAFANKLFQQAVERKLIHLVLHEVGHADDEHNPSKDYSKLQRQEIKSMVQVLGGALLLGLASVEVIERYSYAPESWKTVASTLISLAIAINTFTTAKILSPSERSANQFADLNSSEGGLNTLVTFSPK